ncbi:MAG: DUF4230 domain-containing protein [Marinoscillum sp.]
MISLAKIIFKMLPWLIVVALLSWMLISEKLSLDIIGGEKETYQHTILTRVEAMGKLELVKYNFQEVTEVQKAVARIDFKLFKLPTTLAPDSRAVLISQGSAVGCINLAKLSKSDIHLENDTLFISLPPPELCYFKIDLEKSRIYDLEITGLSKSERKQFMEELYKVAESEIRDSAFKMGILEQTRENAETILTPLLENISGKKVVLSFKLDQSIITSPEKL